jgi:transposase
VSLLSSRKEKEQLVIKLAQEGKTTREIAKQVHVSLRDIGSIIHKETGNKYNSQEEKDKELEIDKQKKFKSLSPYARAFQMFKDKRTLADVAIELDIKSNAVLDFYSDYLCLLRMNNLVTIYRELGQDFPLLMHLFKIIKKEGLDNKQMISDLVKNQLTLKEMEIRIEIYSNYIREQQFKKKLLEQEINYLQQRRDNHDGINPI